MVVEVHVLRLGERRLHRVVAGRPVRGIPVGGGRPGGDAKARAFRGDQSWRDLRAYSLITAVLGLVLLVLFITGVAGSWNGLLQRVFVTVLFLWIAVLGARLIRLSQAQSAEPAT